MIQPARIAQRSSLRAALAAVGVLIGVVVATATRGAAQAICSAPHSSPTLAAGNSIGTLPPATGWVMLSALHVSTRSTFDSRGDRRPLLADGTFRVASAYLSAGAGVVPGVDVWVQVPVHSMHYRDVGGQRSRSGVGDARFAVRLSPELVGRKAPFALRVGGKLPGSAFPVDATVIPLTEGQRDWEASVETGRTFRANAFYMMGWAGHRWRERNDAADRQPGNETFAHWAAGTAVRGVRVELGADLLRGAAPRQLGFRVPAARRQMFQLLPTATRKVGPGDLEFTAILPIAGENLPTGTGLSAGYRIGWDRRRPQLPAGYPSPR